MDGRYIVGSSRHFSPHTRPALHASHLLIRPYQYTVHRLHRHVRIPAPHIIYQHLVSVVIFCPLSQPCPQGTSHRCIEPAPWSSPTRSWSRFAPLRGPLRAHMFAPPSVNSPLPSSSSRSSPPSSTPLALCLPSMVLASCASVCFADSKVSSPLDKMDATDAPVDTSNRKQAVLLRAGRRWLEPEEIQNQWQRGRGSHPSQHGSIHNPFGPDIAAIINTLRLES